MCIYNNNRLHIFFIQNFINLCGLYVVKLIFQTFYLCYCFILDILWIKYLIVSTVHLVKIFCKSFTLLRISITTFFCYTIVYTNKLLATYCIFLENYFHSLKIT